MLLLPNKPIIELVSQGEDIAQENPTEEED